jgi:hypothetical protein
VGSLDEFLVSVKYVRSQGADVAQRKKVRKQMKNRKIPGSLPRLGNFKKHKKFAGSSLKRLAKWQVDSMTWYHLYGHLGKGRLN